MNCVLKCTCEDKCETLERNNTTFRLLRVRTNSQYMLLADNVQFSEKRSSEMWAECETCKNSFLVYIYQVTSKAANVCAVRIKCNSIQAVIYQEPEEVNAEKERTNQCVIYGTKLLRSALGSEISVQKWEAEDIELVMRHMLDQFGEFQAMEPKRKCVMFRFGNRKSLFKKRFIFRDTNEGISYVALTPRMLKGCNDHLLFSLTKCEKILDFATLPEWAIIATANYVLFLSLDSPLQNFTLQQRTNIIKLQPYVRDRVVILLNNHKFLLYCLEGGKVKLEAVYSVPSLSPHCLSFSCKYQSIFLAGLDVETKGFFSDNETISKQRRVYVFGAFISERHQSKTLKCDSMIDILQTSRTECPISSLCYIEQLRLIITTWHKFLFVHEQITKNKIIEVKLSDPLLKCVLLPFSFNLFSMLIHTKQQQLIRVGFQTYHHNKLATEIMKYNLKGAVAFSVQDKELIIASEESISVFDYISEKPKRQLIIGKKVELMSCNNQGVAYICQGEFSREVRFLQF